MTKSKTKVTDPSKKRKPGRPPKRKFFGPPGYVRPSKKSQQEEASPAVDAPEAAATGNPSKAAEEKTET
ncbi:unnamed protein product [Caenorhabditis nigoni]